MTKYDASIVICDREQAESTLEKLPFGAAWRRLYAEAKARGPVSILSTRMTADGAPMAVAFTKPSHSAFERLSLAARAWKELAPSPAAKVLFATYGLEAEHSKAMLEALTAAALAATAAMPVMKSKAPKPAALPQFTLSGEGPDIDADV